MQHRTFAGKGDQERHLMDITCARPLLHIWQPRSFQSRHSVLPEPPSPHLISNGVEREREHAARNICGQRARAVLSRAFGLRGEDSQDGALGREQFKEWRSWASLLRALQRLETNASHAVFSLFIAAEV